MDNHDPAAHVEQLTPLQRAALVIKQLRARLDAVEQARIEPIAIIGMGCRFPGIEGDSVDAESFWNLLQSGGDAITEVPASRWSVADYYAADPDVPGKMYARWGGFLKQIDTFDAQFFGISPREATSMDPQQRLVLEVGWEALENAGQAPDRLGDITTGMFIGIGIGDYATIQTRAGQAAHIDAYLGTGTGFCFASGRLSYILGAQGPSLSVDTACSSSLVAIHLACQSLRANECRMALAGGVNALLAPEAMLFLAKSRALSPTGRCKTFDASADGFVRGEGCGIIVLKRLADALADGDTVLAVIRGSAMNHDGASSGLTVPNGLAQQKLIRQALATARIEPAQVSYVEAHGTGTALGDPIELRALGAVLGSQRPIGQPLLVGSVKTNIGHLEAAAGVSSIIKVVLALRNEEIPPLVHFATPTPHVDWAALAISVPDTAKAWPRRPEQPRIAGVSSFGLSGTNVHILVGEAPQAAVASADPPAAAHLLTLAAKSERALHGLAQRFSAYLATHPTVSLADLCFSASTGRAQLPYRLAVVAGDHGELHSRLAGFSAGQADPATVFQGQTIANKRPKIAFLFTGQGAQYLGMGRQLYATEATFRQAFDRCDAIVQPWLGRSLHAVLYPADPALEAENAALLDTTLFTQPALFALEYALSALWRSWGIEPAAVIGHSVGEYVAACVAGVFSLEDGLKLIVGRARLMHELPADGAMAAVFAPIERVRAAIQPFARVGIAAINGPRNSVISGLRAEVEAAVESLIADGIQVKQLNVARAFHSPLMQPMLADFRRIAEEVTYAAPTIDLISNLAGERNPPALATPGYWVDHIVAPVAFAAGIATLQRCGCDVWLEVGPQPVLVGMARQSLPEEAEENSRLLVVGSLQRDHPALEQLFQAAAALHVYGATIDWGRFYQGQLRQKIALPTYAFQRQRYWVDLAPAVASGTVAQAATAPSSPAAPLYHTVWEPVAAPPLSAESAGSWLILADHQGLGQELAALLQAQGSPCALVFAGPAYAAQSASRYTVNPLAPADFRQLLHDTASQLPTPLSGIVHMWSMDTSVNDLSTSALNQAQELLCGSTLHLIQALGRLEWAVAPQLCLVTHSSQAVAAEAPIEAQQAPLWGLGRVIRLEQPELRCLALDLDGSNRNAMADQIRRELRALDGEQEVAYWRGQRYVSRLQPYVAAQPGSAALPIAAEGSYLITGGLGTLGLHSAAWLVSQGARSLALLSRSEPSESSAAAIRQLEVAGAQVVVLGADVANPEELAAAFERIDKQLPPLRGIIHTAGTLADGLLHQQSWGQFARVLAPKVAGTWNLHRLAAGRSLDFLVCFSSIAATFGSPGQANYVAANAFLDGFAQHRRTLGLPGTSINWGPWAESRMEASNGDRRAAQGLALLTTAQALQALTTTLQQRQTQLQAVLVDWPAFLAQLPQALQRTLLSRFGVTLTSPPVAAPSLRQHLEALPQPERRAVLVEQIRELAAQVLKLESAADVAPRQALFELGLDSIMALELKNRLANSLGCSLRQTLVFDYPTAETLADHLGQAVPGLLDPRPLTPPQPSSSQTLAAEIDELSEEEAEALLAQMIGKLTG